MSRLSWGHDLASDTGTQLPDKIGDYHVERRLGRGGMGEVLLAHDTHLDRTVAIKLIRSEQALKERSRKRFLREAQAIARLDHPSIVKIYHVQQWEKHHCIVMERIEGTTIASMIESAPFSVSRVAGLLLQIAEGLGEAHARGIVHRDLKASNVMVTPQERVKILDFGLAKYLAASADDSLSVSGAVLGTLHTMSPEQASGETVDTATDLFSLGVLAYEMLSGTSPFRAETDRETVTRVIAHRQPPVRELNSAVPQGLSDLVDRLLAKDPKQRPPSAQDVTSTILAWVEAPTPPPSGAQPAGVTTVVDRPSPSAERFAPTLPAPERSEALRRVRKPRFFAIAIVVMIVVMVAVFLTIWRAPVPITTVAVLGFATEAPGEAWRSTILSELIDTRLSAHDRLTTLGGSAASSVRRAAGLPVDPQAEDLDRLRGAVRASLSDVAITGVWQHSDDQIHLRLDWRRPGGETGHFEIEGGGKSLAELADQAARGLERALGLGGKAPEFKLITSFPSLEATQRSYALGLEAQRSGELLAARDHFSEAIRSEPGNALLHAAHAHVLWQLGFIREAAPAARAALEYAATLPETVRLEVEARSQVILGETVVAEDLYRQLTDRRPDETNFAVRRVELLRQLGRRDEALELLIQLRQKASDLWTAQLDVAEAYLYLEHGEHEKAERLAQRAAVHSEEAGAPFVTAQAQLALALVYERVGEHDKALGAAQEAQELFSLLGDFRSMVEALSQEAIALATSGQLETARERFEAYKQYFEDRGDRLAAARFQVNESIIFFRRGELAKAVSLLEPAAETLRKLNAVADFGQAMNNLGAAYFNLGRLDVAASSYWKALAAHREFQSVGEISIVQMNIAEIQQVRGELEAAQAVYQEVLNFASSFEEAEGEVFVLLRLGEIALERLELEVAQEHFTNARERAGRIGAEPLVAEAFLALAHLELAKNNAGEAESLARRAERLYGESHQRHKAQLVRAEALLARSLPALEDARQLVAEVHLTSAGKRDRRLSFERELLSASLEGHRDGNLAQLRSRLEPLASDAEAAGFHVDAARARLALGIGEIEAGEEDSGRRRLEAVLVEAEEKGWTRLARLAERHLGQ